MKLMHKLFCVALFTASCDVVLNVQIGGSLRLAQLMMLLMGMGAIARVIQDGRILWPRGATALAIWVVWQGLCIPVAGNFGIAMQFYVLLLFTVFSWLSVVQLYGESDLIESLMRVYLWSFIVVAAYGALQLFMPLLFHITMPYTRQWLLYGRVPRISAFSYEPSYFATYMFLGYTMLVDLWFSRARLVAGRAIKVGTVLVVATLILSSSKTAWLCIAVDVVVRIAPRIWKRARLMTRELAGGALHLPLPRRRTLAFMVLGCALAVGLAVAVDVILPNPYILLAGTGLLGSPAHSYNDRNIAVDATWNIVKQSPLIGRSMGGVPVAIGNAGGVEVTTMVKARLFWGFPVLLDVYAASGLFGFIPFAIFLWVNTFGAYKMARAYMPMEAAKWLRAAARAMILEWILLLGDQNLFRVYLWFHFSIVTLLMYYIEYGRLNLPENQAELSPTNESETLGPKALGANV